MVNWLMRSGELASSGLDVLREAGVTALHGGLEVIVQEKNSTHTAAQARLKFTCENLKHGVKFQKSVSWSDETKLGLFWHMDAAFV